MRNPSGTGVDRLVTAELSAWHRLWHPLSKVLAVIGGFGLFFVLLFGAGWLAERQLIEEDRFTISFSEIECNAPPVGDRITFLKEVWYLTEAPKRWNLFDRNLFPKLKSVITRHPRVESLESVTVTPNRRIVLNIKFVQ